MSKNIDNYGWNEKDEPESCDYLVPAIIKILSKYTEIERVCDVGCGSGHLIKKLFEIGYKVSGADNDEEACRISKSRNPLVNIFNIGFHESPLPMIEKERFDAVVATEVVEHLYSPHELPQFASKILKPNGLIILSTPYHGFLKNLALSIFNKWDSHFTALWHGGHVKFWSKSTLSTLLNNNGFEIIHFSGVGRIPFLWKSMIIVARAKEF